jgi:hypothetical protein
MLRPIDSAQFAVRLCLASATHANDGRGRTLFPQRVQLRPLDRIQQILVDALSEEAQERGPQLLNQVGRSSVRREDQSTAGMIAGSARRFEGGRSFLLVGLQNGLDVWIAR